MLKLSFKQIGNILFIKFILSLTFLIAIEGIRAQSNQGTTKATFGKGINYISSDSLFTLQFNGKLQSMFEARNNLITDQLSGDFLIRRCRMSILGMALDPRFTYKIQFGFSHGDLSSSNSKEANNLLIIEAMLFYKTNKWLRLGLGQAKLPGNRQRQISFSNLQLVERSTVNGSFTLDIDKGFWVYTNFKIKESIVKSTVVITTGEGRIRSNKNGQLSFLGRVEYLPFGAFTNNGDYLESDIERESKPKLSIAAAYNYNKGASRTMGQLGDYFLNSATTNITYYGFDMMFKYRGFSLSSEWYHRDSDKLIFVDGIDDTKRNNVIAGNGFYIQSGYMVNPKNEVAVRYAQITPNEKLTSLMLKSQEYVLGFSHFFYKHSLKLQTDLSYQKAGSNDQLIYRLSGIMGF